MFILSGSKLNKENVQTVKMTLSLFTLSANMIKKFFRNLIEPLISIIRNLLGRKYCTGWEDFRGPKV